MADLATAKKRALEHCWRVNAGDVAGLLALYTPGVRFEDPVGSGPQVGHAALRAHAAEAIGAGVREVPGVPVGSVDRRQAALPVTGYLPFRAGSPLLAALGPAGAAADPATSLLRMDYVMVVRVGADGLIEEMRSYWDPADLTVVDRDELPGGAPHAG